MLVSILANSLTRPVSLMIKSLSLPASCPLTRYPHPNYRLCYTSSGILFIPTHSTFCDTPAWPLFTAHTPHFVIHQHCPLFTAPTPHFVIHRPGPPLFTAPTPHFVIHQSCPLHCSSFQLMVVF